MGRSTVTHVWLSGHILNIGDSALRRAYADALREFGGLRIWSSAPGTGYEEGLGGRSGELSPSFARWYWSYVMDVLRGRSVFAFNAGEFGVTKSYFTGIALLMPWLLLAKLTRGKIIWMGAGVPRRRKGFIWLFDILAALSHPLRWRDVNSPELMLRGGVMPDWAFALDPRNSVSDGGDLSERGYEKRASTEPATRTYLTLSLRGDREYPSEAWLDAVSSLGDRLGLSVVAVAQVAEDDRFAARLAADLDAEFAGWTYESHREQEALVRELYSRSMITLSDRLHGLIIAATEGSVPLAWTEHSTSKISTHFDVVGADWVACGTPALALEGLRTLEADRLDELVVRTAEAVADARFAIRDAVRELASIL